MAALILAFAYSLTLWVTVRRGAWIPGRILEVTDPAVALALVAVLDPGRSAFARTPILLMLIGWALLCTQRELWVRGLGVSVFVGAVGTARHDVATGGKAAAYTLVVLAICSGVARRVAERSARIAALEARAGELQAEVGDLERRERARMAQLLHDDALQRLLAARQDLDQGLDGDAEALARAVGGLGDATHALRGLTFVANDDALQAAGLESAVRRIVADAAARAGLQTTVQVDPGLDGTLGPVVLPIVRELVSNVERHAAASELRVALVRQSGAVVIEVGDDGRGVTRSRLHDAVRDGHLGISGLRRRVAGLHGTIDIDGRPGAGTDVRVVLADEEIRAQRAVEDALRNEREWNAALVAGFPDPFVVTTVDMRVVDVSDRFVATTGWSRAELLAAGPGQLPYIEPEAADEVRERAVRRSGEREYESEEVLVCRDGRRLDVIASVHNVRDPRGQRALRLVTFKDISARRATERQLREERDLSTAFRRIMREAYMQTLDGVIVDVNDALCALLGFSREDLIGAERPYFFFPREGLPDAFAFATGVEEQGQAEATLQVRRADGVVIEVAVVGVAVRAANGRRLGRMLSVRAAGPVPAMGPIVPLSREV
ncbi:hypothetical protein DSM112329_02278 [Paraconexibacter sp. AEG42_29]|uniref:histidine kinase n=1 Tax=Paraconexibacter sp. AEG42_29 TaxID=2997339 RepID=A0AAU7AVD0_9ACTN